MNEREEKRIWAYLDGHCSEQEASEVEKLVREDPTFARLFQSCERIHRSLEAMPLGEPSTDFTDAVLKRVVEARTGSATSTRQVSKWPVVIGFVVAAIIILIVPMSNEGQTGLAFSWIEDVFPEDYMLLFVSGLLALALLLVGDFLIRTSTISRLNGRQLSAQ